MDGSTTKATKRCGEKVRRDRQAPESGGDEGDEEAKEKCPGVNVVVSSVGGGRLFSGPLPSDTTIRELLLEHLPPPNTQIAY